MLYRYKIVIPLGTALTALVLKLKGSIKVYAGTIPREKKTMHRGPLRRVT